MNKIRINEHLLESNCGWFIKTADVPYGRYIANDEKTIFVFEKNQIFINEDLKLYWNKKGLKFILKPIGSSVQQLVDKIVDYMLKPELVIKVDEYDEELYQTKPKFYIYFYDNL